MSILICPYIGSFSQEILIFIPYVRYILSILHDSDNSDVIIVASHSNRKFLYDDIGVDFYPVFASISRNELCQKGVLYTEIDKQQFNQITKSIKNNIGGITDHYNIPYVKNHNQISYYQKIFEKIDHWLKQGGISSILFIADEWLYAIPINILFDGRQYLTQKYKIAYLANSSYIIGNERKKTNFYQFLGMAPLVEELPASSAEIQTAAQYIEGKKVVLLGNTATERIFKQLCSHSKIIHLATHGQFSSFQPEFSFLLFTGDQTNDGFFYLYELDSLNLSAVLVNISACRLVGRPLHSSSYQIQVGFGYKFLRSGATNVLLASFPLRDAFARHFSQIFYAQLKNHTIGTALQKTQQFFINRNISPSLWGSYIWLTNRINFMEQPILANTN